MKTKQFQKAILHYYRKNGRDLPWRRTNDPYKIFISEIMLQQTQVSRVQAKYPIFIKQFPSFDVLAQSSLRDILRVWQGMGYNRRALYLKQSAEIIVAKYGGNLPKNPILLLQLPGIGTATASSISVFAFNKPAVFIETNIRRVFIQFFFKNRKKISDQKILKFVEKTLPNKDPKEWYWALMDYGTMLRVTGNNNPNRKSIHYKKQSKFDGSRRQLRGIILKLLLQKSLSLSEIIEQSVHFSNKTVQDCVKKLIFDKLITKEHKKYTVI